MTKYCKWITQETKDKMLQRDNVQEMVRTTQDEANWLSYKVLRNNCTKDQRKDRRKYLRMTYDNIENENDSARLYSLTKQLLGWKGSRSPQDWCRMERQLLDNMNLLRYRPHFILTRLNKLSKISLV